MITHSQTIASINDLPLEILKDSLSFLDLKRLMEIAPTNKTIEKLVREFFWDKIFTYQLPSCPSSINKESILSKAVKRIEPLFDSIDEKDQIKLNDFMRRCNSMDVTKQIDFLDKFTYFISHRHRKRYSKLLINLFNHPSTPKGSKLQILNEQDKKFLSELKFEEPIKDEGLIPNHYKPFRYELVPANYTSKFNISDQNSFKKGELVVVVEHLNWRGSVGSILYFGKIHHKVSSNQWRVLLVFTENNQLQGLVHKTALQIGKFSKDCELPSFCSM